MLMMNEPLSSPVILQDTTIFVVDNNRDSRDLYAFLLETQGATVVGCESVKDALTSLEQQVPSLVVCEINFPGESVTPLIRQVELLALMRGRTIPILVTSTDSLISFAQRQVKAEAYLLKPIDIDGFVHRIWSLIKLSGIHYSFCN